VSIAAPAIGGDQEAGGPGIAILSHGQPPPPPAQGVNRETGGIVIAADTDPALVIANIVDAVRNGASQFAQFPTSSFF
jgi:hypothetical protein